MYQMRMDRLSQLEKFEAEQRDKELDRRNQIFKEKQENKRIEQELKLEQERMEKEKVQLQRVVEMFNGKELPSFTIGGVYIRSHICPNLGPGNCSIEWVYNKQQKYIFHLEMLIRIQKLNIDELYEIYKNILEDYFWIKKYGPEEHLEYPNKPYVDFCFDNYIDKIDELITEKKRIILQSDGNISTHIQFLKINLEYLIGLKREITEPREYYYVNDDKLSSYMPLRWSRPKNGHITNNEDTFTTWFITLQKHIDNFLEEFLKYFDRRNLCDYSDTAQSYYNCNKNNICNILRITTSYKNYIKYCIMTKNKGIRYGISDAIEIENIYEKNYEFSHLIPLLTLGKLIIELIEFLRPDILIKYTQNNTRQNINITQTGSIEENNVSNDKQYELNEHNKTNDDIDNIINQLFDMGFTDDANSYIPIIRKHNGNLNDIVSQLLF